MDLHGVAIRMHPEEIEALEDLVREWNPFVTTALLADDPYSLVDHVLAGNDPDFKLHVLLDRNLMSCVSGLARGNKVSADAGSAETSRVAAGCMAYFILGGATIEPNIALYEHAVRKSTDDTITELRAFRVADNIEPSAYVDIALGRSTRVAADSLEVARSATAAIADPILQNDYTVRPSGLAEKVAALTKIAILEHECRSPRERVERLLTWFRDDFLFLGGALTFALIFYGHNRPGGMLKGINSRSFAKCRQGIRNAAWDLVYVDYWLRRSREEDGNAAWLFCSRDHALLSIARRVAAPDSPEAKAEAQRELFAGRWSDADAAHLKSLSREIEEGERRDRAARRAAREAMRPVDEMIAELEEELRSHVET